MSRVHRRRSRTCPTLLAAGIVGFTCLRCVLTAEAQQKPPTEDDYYPLTTIPIPEDVVLEVGGLAWKDEARTRLLACTRRGELWVLDNVYAKHPALAGTKVTVKTADGKTVETEPAPAQIVRYQRMLFGLHEPLGLVVNPGHGFPKGIYTAQRSELTRLVDENDDDRIDLVQTYCNEWEISGSYHEYAFGPKLGKDGMLWITLNRPFGGGQEPTAYWRGWAIKVDDKGHMHPVCPGLRSPAGLGTGLDGEMFYTDNQGDHVAVGKLGHLKEGVFHGNPIGLNSVDHPRSNFELPSKDYPKRGMLWGEAVELNPHLQAPAVWFPYPDMGQSQTDVLTDTTGGKFGPFAGQMFVGDLTRALVLRVFLEKVGGEYQGACFPFRQGFDPPVLRMTWGKDGALFVGGSSRGWGGGRRPYGLQRVDFSGEAPFEMHEMHAQPKGFQLTFTHPVDPQTAGDPKSYALRCWTYHYHSNYGDKPQDTHDLKITGVKVASDGKSATLTVEGLSPYYVHELRAPGVRSAAGLPLLHPIAYYTLNRIPR